MSDPVVIFTGHSQSGSETIQAQKWHTIKRRGAEIKPLTPTRFPESSSLAEAQERFFIYLRTHPDVVDHLRGWTIFHHPAETGIRIEMDGTVTREGA